MVATIGNAVALRAIKLGILPVPLAARPIEGALLVQLNTNVPPVVGLVKFTGAVAVFAHNDWLAG